MSETDKTKPVDPTAYIKDQADHLLSGRHANEPKEALIEELVREGVKRRTDVLRSAVQLRRDIQQLVYKTKPDSVRVVVSPEHPEGVSMEDWTPATWAKKQQLDQALLQLDPLLAEVLAGPDEKAVRRLAALAEAASEPDAILSEIEEEKRKASKAFGQTYEKLDKLVQELSRKFSGVKAPTAHVPVSKKSGSVDGAED